MILETKTKRERERERDSVCMLFCGEKKKSQMETSEKKKATEKPPSSRRPPAVCSARPRVQPGPLAGGGHGAALVFPPLAGDGFVQGVVRVGRREQRLDRQQHGANLERGRPLVFEDVQADAAQAVNVGVVDAGEEADLVDEREEGWVDERC